MPPRTKTAKAKAASSKATSSKAAKKKAPAKKQGPPKRKTIYAQVESRLCIGKDALNPKQARELLGWEVIESGNGILKDEEAKTIVCHNNVTNRPLYKPNYLSLKQEILRKKWQFNGEPIIIGKTGLILNGQHTLIALVLAGQTWKQDREKWSAWRHEPCIDKLIVFGVQEDDNVVNTMDTCKPRSLMDVIYRSAFFADKPANVRKMVARYCDYCVRLLWHRTGASLDAFAPRRTHSESLDFINRHSRLLEAVSHVAEENGNENRIGAYLSPGYAAALLYLMAVAESDSDEYASQKSPSEEHLTFSLWDKACDFWTLLAGDAKELGAVRKVLAAMLEEGGGSVAERCALLVKAWSLWLAGKPVTLKSLALQYHEDDDEIRTLAELPTVGGIDLGDASAKQVEINPTPAEISEVAAQVRANRGKKGGKSTTPEKPAPLDKLDDPKAKQGGKASRKGKDWAKGDKAWVVEPGEDTMFGTITEGPYDTDAGRKVVIEDGSGAEWEVDVTDLQLEMPDTL